MKLEKSKLNFLELYNVIANTKSFYNDKLKIELKDGKSYFSILSDKVTMITELDTDSKNESFEVMIPLKNLTGLISSLPDDTILEISENHIRFNDKARYSFEAVDTLTPEKAIDIIESFNQMSFEEDILPEINKIQPLLKFNGKDDLEPISCYKNHYFSSNGIVMANIPLTKTPNDRVNIALGLCNLLRLIEVEGNNIKFKRFENGVYSFQLSNTYVYVPEVSSDIPDIFEEERFKGLNHELNVKLSSSDLIPVLNRMSHVVTETNNTISITFDSDSITVGTKKYNESSETIPCEILDSSLVGRKISLSLNNFLTCIQSGTTFCKNKIVYLGVGDDDAPNIKIAVPTDETESSFFYFFLILFEGE